MEIQVNLFSLMEIYMKVSLKKILFGERVYLHGKMVENMKENLLIIKWKERAALLGLNQNKMFILVNIEIYYNFFLK